MDRTDPAGQDPEMASPGEVLRYLSAVMRGEAPLPLGDGLGDGPPPPRSLPTAAERMKAAELLGKRYRLFSESTPDQEALPIFVDDIPREGKQAGSKASPRRRGP